MTNQTTTTPGTDGLDRLRTLAARHGWIAAPATGRTKYIRPDQQDVVTVWGRDGVITGVWRHYTPPTDPRHPMADLGPAADALTLEIHAASILGSYPVAAAPEVAQPDKQPDVDVSFDRERGVIVLSVRDTTQSSMPPREFTLGPAVVDAIRAILTEGA